MDLYQIWFMVSSRGRNQLIFRLCEKEMSVARSGLDEDNYMHQILRNNALDISLYNSLYG